MMLATNLECKGLNDPCRRTYNSKSQRSMATCLKIEGSNVKKKIELLYNSKNELIRCNIPNHYKSQYPK